MRKVQTPSGREVDVADIFIKYVGHEEVLEVSVVIDDHLALELHNYLDELEWEFWDNEFFFYLTQEEWEQLQSGSPVSDEWNLVIGSSAR